ncbi:helix-turn-helix transcriptional regulator [uncultured Roseovarius sp.]|uniref:helix-turn-helix domain-containing protein n=1 Tax=uncultured Roseovarius sp. TaxID=293344 RepID=UPI00262C7FAB|nr:helix-turn-helix transcriptional regulator [uncultured Roseovarius sp.]
MERLTNIFVGICIRHRRWQLGITQVELAENIGVEFQQLQKCETGGRGISVSMLQDISRALSVDMSFFGNLESDPVQD